jgi:carboxyl-terminal processing protease
VTQPPASARAPQRPRAWLSTLLFAVLLVALVGGAFVSGALADRAGVLPGHRTATEPTSVASTFGVFWEAWNLVEKHYVDQAAVKPLSLTYGAIQGMLGSLGDAGHTRFLTPDEAKAEQQALSGSVEGIGAEVQLRDGAPVITAPLPNSPAQRAGIRAGDVIHAVDGTLTAGMTIDQVVNLVRGTPGTAVTLEIIHAGDTTPVTVRIVREKVDFPLVTWAMLPGTTLAHVQVSSFGDHASDQLVAALKAAQAQGATGVVLDLRDDPGGLLDEAVNVISQFVGSGNALIEQNAQGRRTAVSVKHGGVALQTPLVVLINGGTASASEVTAGALRDHGRAQLVGAKTFGTGTVLSTYTLSDSSEVLLGTDEWLTPNGQTFWKVGIAPDVAVSLPTGVAAVTPLDEAAMSAAQLRASGDAPLLRAIDVLQPGFAPLPAPAAATPAATATATP